MTSSPRPIFVLGSLRSGATLLTWSLGQHPNIRPMLDNRWLHPFASSLEPTFAAAVRERAVSQLDIMGIELEDFSAHFGVAIDDLLRRGAGPSDRWVDGSPDHCFNVVGLRRLFPQARFLHVVREVGEVVTALTSEAKRARYRSHWRPYTEEAACAHWLETVKAGVAAERSYGSATVMRVRRGDLVGAPEATLRRVLSFVGEPFAPACLRPFR